MEAGAVCADQGESLWQRTAEAKALGQEGGRAGATERSHHGWSTTNSGQGL